MILPIFTRIIVIQNRKSNRETFREISVLYYNIEIFGFILQSEQGTDFRFYITIISNRRLGLDKSEKCDIIKAKNPFLNCQTIHNISAKSAKIADSL